MTPTCDAAKLVTSVDGALSYSPGFPFAYADRRAPWAREAALWSVLCPVLTLVFGMLLPARALLAVGAMAGIAVSSCLAVKACEAMQRFGIMQGDERKRVALGLPERQTPFTPIVHRLALGVVHVLLHVVLLGSGYVYRVVGKPDPTADLMVCTHTSPYDMVLMGCVTKPGVVAKSDLAGSFLTKWLLMVSQSLLVHRTAESGGPRGVTQQMRSRIASRHLARKQGKLVQRTINRWYPPLVIFSEGTTTTHDTVIRLHSSAFAVGARVQPVALCYRGYVLGQGYVGKSVWASLLCTWLNPFAYIEIKFLPTVDTAGAAGDLHRARAAADGCGQLLAAAIRGQYLPYTDGDYFAWAGIPSRRAHHTPEFLRDFPDACGTTAQDVEQSAPVMCAGP